jgi:putative ABC transport system permease protein
LVVVVSKSVAERLFPGQDALNRHILWTDPLIKVAGISPKGRRIIGLLADVDDANILPQHNLTIYQPFAQGPVFGASLLVRSDKDPMALIPSITKTIRAVAATQPVEHASTLEDVRTEVLANNRVNAIIPGRSRDCWCSGGPAEGCPHLRVFLLLSMVSWPLAKRS